MAINVYTKAWATMPGSNAKAITGHTLTPRIGFIANHGWHDLVRKTPVIVGSASQGRWKTNSVRGYGGIVRQHDNVNNYDLVNVDGNMVIPPSNMTIVLGYQKTDSTPRASTAIGEDDPTDGTARCHLYLPWSDGSLYFDFGTGQRIIVGGLTFGDDVWVIDVGPRGSEVWQNGILRGSDVEYTKAAWTGGERVAFGKGPAFNLSDLAMWKFVYFYHRQLTVSEISRITKFPFDWVDRRH